MKNRVSFVFFPLFFLLLSLILSIQLWARYAAMPQSYSTASSYPIPFNLLAPAYFLRYPNPLATHVLSVDVLDRQIVQRPASTASSSSHDVQGSKSVLLTARLILKMGTLPSWAPRGLIKNAESWVLEVTEVDLETDRSALAAARNRAGPSTSKEEPYSTTSPFSRMFQRGWGSQEGSTSTNLYDDAAAVPGRQMRTWTRNLDHTTVLAVAEGLTFTELLKDPLPSTIDVKGKGKAATSAPSSTPLGTTHCLTSGHISSDVSVLWHRIEMFGLKRFKAHMDTSHQGLLYTASLLSPHLYSHEHYTPPKTTRFTRWREALRPPWLDGLPTSGWQKFVIKVQSARVRGTERYMDWKERWGIGEERREREESMSRWRDSFREKVGRLRQWKRSEGSIEEASRRTAPSSNRDAEEEALQEEEEKQEERESGEGQEILELPRDRIARLAHQARQQRS